MNRFDWRIIDTRTLVEEMRELEDMIEDDEGLDEDDRDKLDNLRELSNEITDFYNGETLIHEDYFEEYAKELASDIGAINSDMGWPLTCIDWTRAANELMQDYTEVEYDGSTYLVRAY